MLPATQPSIAEVRRAAAVGGDGMRLGLAWVPGVVLADVMVSAPASRAWMPAGHVLVTVWGGEGPKVWQAIQGSPYREGFQIVLQVWPVTRWSRWRAWWRWTLHRVERALEGNR